MNSFISNTIAFCLLELARNPDFQNYLRQEIMDFEGEPSYSDYQTKLPYLDAVVKET